MRSPLSPPRGRSVPIALIGAVALLLLPAGCGEKENNVERSTHRFADPEGDAARRAAKAKSLGADGEADANAPAARSGGGTSVDALRTLPYVGFSDASHADAPMGVGLWDKEKTHSGYTLLTTRDLCRSELIDMSGNVVHSWTQPGVLWANAKLLPNGDLLVVGADPAPRPGAGAPEGAGAGAEAGQRAPAREKLSDEERAKRREAKKNRSTEGHGYLLRLSWDNALIWKKKLQAHHDVSVLPDGRILVLTASIRKIPELDKDHEFRDDAITILSPDGDPVESLSLFELLRDAPEPYRLRTSEPWFWETWFGHKEPLRFQPVTFDVQKGGVADLLHTNTVQPIPAGGVGREGPLYAPGNVLVTTRHQDVISIVSLAEKKIVWTWGPGEVMGPHDASWLPNGNILVFDNGLGRDWSRVIEVDPVSGEIGWEYVGDPVEEFYTATRGANQRLPDGNTLITESDKGHLFEILPDGTKVWDFWTPHRNERGQLATITRASRFSEAELAPLLSASAPPAAPPAP